MQVSVAWFVTFTTICADNTTLHMFKLFIKMSMLLFQHFEPFNPVFVFTKRLDVGRARVDFSNQTDAQAAMILRSRKFSEYI